MTPDDPAPGPPATPPLARRVRARAAWAWRVASVRLRFVLVLGAAVLAMARWDDLRDGWARLSAAAAGADPAAQPVSVDTEYFCPMDPGVVSDWPNKCPICNMALVRRRRGDAAPLPEGVVARMQFSPYRIQLAGIRSVPVEYRPLALEVEGPARVVAPAGPGGEAELDVELFAADARAVVPGQEAVIRPGDGEPLAATVRSVGEPDAEGGAGVVAARVAARDPLGRLRPGHAYPATVRVPAASTEPFRSMPSGPPPLREGEPRRAYVCPDHPEALRERPGRCPQDRKTLHRIDLSDGQRLRWWCPMHPEVVADEPGRKCEPCGGMVLVPRVVHFAPAGMVLAVPESAVVDTGTRRVVYVETMPGMYDGVEVTLGPRCGDTYPVIRGLEPGGRVVAAGAFLVDAETRLNPSLAAAYFGATGRGQAQGPTAAGSAQPDDDELSPADRAAVVRQKICPVTGKPLGSMGTPEKVEVEGRSVFVCCSGCEPALRGDPAKWLARLPAAAGPAAGGP